MSSSRSLLIPIVRQNLSETSSILTQHINDGSTSSSVLLTPSDIPTSLDHTECPNHPPCTIRVINTDALSAAITILRPSAAARKAEAETEEEDGDADAEYDASQCAEGDLLSDDLARGKTIVLNSCSDERPGGGYSDLVSEAEKLGCPLPTTHISTSTSLSIPPIPSDLPTTQEESLCLNTTLFTTLNPHYYPWPNTGPSSIRGIYSPGIVIFRDPTTHHPLPLSSRHVISILSIAAPRNRPLTPDRTTFSNPTDLDLLRQKIRFWLRTAAMNGQERLVLGAWGCGSHMCPPGMVAREMRRALEEVEFRGWFREVVFAIRDGVGKGNFGVFREVLDGVVV